jgi:hypothetical protein
MIDLGASFLVASTFLVFLAGGSLTTGAVVQWLIKIKKLQEDS